MPDARAKNWVISMASGFFVAWIFYANHPDNVAARVLGGGFMAATAVMLFLELWRWREKRRNMPKHRSHPED
ncbi:hypothetical protein Rhe02_08720 [Rhizocola hellebori]|uniref:Uncharacterized protein n=1 Tax=Rhizocola hellebori TaxID=1392758 RepID=A0A8J3Q2T5_9ACTN|nr:hypothetical protein Rhe02_08720 [Rhizocola hellebori]